MNQDEYSAEQKYELGREEGRKWAANHATHEQRERLAEVDELDDDPDFEEGFADGCLEGWYKGNPSFEQEFLDWATAHPAPIISDLCSVQAASADPAGPVLTIYREQCSIAEDWIAGAVQNKRFGAYLLQNGNYSMFYYGHGCPVDSGDFSPTNQSGESTTPAPVDRAAFLQEARELTGDAGLSLIACREGHAGASAADHSNFNVICRRMIGQASPADLEHIVLVDSMKWPCLVTGLFANVAQLSPAMQDVFLDRVKWLENSWPMVSREFHELLAGQLARLRRDYVCELLRHCGKVARMPENRITAMVAEWMLASPEPSYRFALHIVETLREGLIHEANTAETFSPEFVKLHGAAVVKNYKKHLPLSRLKPPP